MKKTKQSTQYAKNVKKNLTNQYTPMEYKYHKGHKYTTEDGTEVSLNSQLYKTGVYCIINNDPEMQFGCSPRSMAKTERKLKEAEKNGEIKDLEFMVEITVKEVDGLWEKV